MTPPAFAAIVSAMLSLALAFQVVTEGEELRLGSPVSAQVAEGVEAAWHLVSPEAGWVYVVAARPVEDSPFEPVLELYPRDRSERLLRAEDWRDDGVWLEWLASSAEGGWVRVTGFTGEPGPYTLTLSRSELVRPTWEEPVVGEITDAERSRWYGIDARAGQLYDWTAGPDGLKDPLIELFNPAMKLLAADDDSGGQLGARLVWASVRDGLVLLRIRPAPAGGLGTFRLTGDSREPQTGESPLRPQEVQLSLTDPAPVDGEIDLPCVGRWFAVSLAAETAYRIDVAGGTLEDPVLQVYDSSGEQMLASDDDGMGEDTLNPRLDWTPERPGRYLLRVLSYEPDQRGTFRLTIGRAAPQ